jgi:polyhydroxyalkanoate synthesis regulator phasin
VNERRGALQNQIETVIRQVLGKMDIVSRAELQELRKNLQELHCKVDALADLKTE